MFLVHIKYSIKIVKLGDKFI